ncbi:MAG TPA: ABC transporter permease, partial [Nitrospira sp.]|nr:ABC transporter permease [Nitrospira sp.]
MIARWAIASLFFACLIGLWQLAVNAQIWSPLLLPSPSNVFIYLWSALEDGTLWEATLVTVQRLLIGYG